MLRFKEIIDILKKIKENSIFIMSNALAFRIILSFFPFIVFIIASLSFFDIDYEKLIYPMIYLMPQQIQKIIIFFIDKVLNKKDYNIISISLFATIFSASSGFVAIIKMLNRFYGIDETRNFILLRIISVFIMLLVLVFSIVASIFFILWDVFFVVIEIEAMSNIIKYSVIFILLCIMLSAVYLMAINVKINIISVLPGVLFTVIIWFGTSVLFEIYLNCFANFSTIYGTIGTIFVFFYWINMVSFVFLIGGGINAYFFEIKK